MKLSRQTALSASVGARTLRGNPPRIHSRIGSLSASSRMSSGPSSRYAMRPARLSPDCRSRRSIEAEPSSRNCPGGLAAADALVDDTAQRLKQVRDAVDFVQYDQAVAFRGEIAARIRQLLPVHRILQIEVQALPGDAPLMGLLRLREGSRQRGLADLARSQEGHGGEQPQPLPQARTQQSRDCVAHHPCNYGAWNQIYKST